MLKISALQMEQITRAHFFRKLTDFLLTRTQQADMRKALLERETLEDLWAPFWPQLKDQNERVGAVTLTYLLSLHCQGEPLVQSLGKIIQTEAPEFHMQRYFSQHSDLRFSEFDLDLEE